MAKRKPTERAEAPATAKARVAPEALNDFVASNDEGGPATGPVLAPASEALVELLIFSLGSEDYAVPVSTLREIVRPPPLSEVPRADPSVMGVTMLRGEVVPVYDPRPRLGLPGRPEPTSASRVIIASVTQGGVGLWVDAVRSVVRVLPSQLEAPPAGVGIDPGAISSLGRAGGKLFVVLNLPVLVASERKESA